MAYSYVLVRPISGNAQVWWHNDGPDEARKPLPPRQLAYEMNAFAGRSLAEVIAYLETREAQISPRGFGMWVTCDAYAEVMEDPDGTCRVRVLREERGSWPPKMR